MNMIFREFLILYQFFFSPQVKRSVIISNEDGISELSHELLNDLRLRATQPLGPLPHGIFAAGGGLCAHTRKKRLRATRIFAAGGGLCAHTSKKRPRALGYLHRSGKPQNIMEL